MYNRIYVPVDNSDFSNEAIERAVQLGASMNGSIVGCHVYAARMHDYRFKQMEYTLPDEYLEETELNRQRKIHDSLITMGLKLISDSYLGPVEKRCAEAGVPFEPRMMDGKHSEELIRDVAESDYDLVVIGAMGLGRVRDSQVGSVCERVTRSVATDVWVVKNLPSREDAAPRDTILVGVDGSPQSFGALRTALDLGKKFDKKVEAIAVYDPYLHYSVFNGIVDVLSEKAAKVFRFEEQNQLHEEVIDTGLAQIYQSHLDVAESIAREDGVEIRKTLLDGKAFQKVLNHARQTRPWLLVLGRIGVHGRPDDPGLGSNSENLFRSAPCDVLFTTRLEHPRLDVRAEETIKWTPEAQERMKRVPESAIGIARTAIYRLAVEQGHSVITSDLLDEAIERFMPKGAKATTKLAEALVASQAREWSQIAICRRCGVSAAEERPERCSVCHSADFELVTADQVDAIIEAEGGADEGATYDGRKLTWTRDAKRGLWKIADAYRRRRTKARIEKAARMRRLGAVALDFARTMIEEELDGPLVLEERGDAPAEAAEPRDEGRRLIGRDAKKNPLFSSWEWTSDAAERMLRVPAGFMRNRTQGRIEELAESAGATRIDLDLVEEGIELGRQAMEAMIAGYKANPEASRAEVESGEAATEDGGRKSVTPRIRAADVTRADERPALNEVGVHSEMERIRREQSR